MNEVILAVVAIVFLVLVGVILRTQFRTVERFQPSPSATNLFINDGVGAVIYSVGAMSAPLAGPPGLPQATLDTIGKAYTRIDLFTNIMNKRKNNKLSDIYRIDWFTHIPYLMDFDRFNNTRYCVKEYSVGSRSEGTRQVKTFNPRSTNDTDIKDSRSLCNIQITPQVLGTLPPGIQTALSDAIYNEQVRMSFDKEDSIVQTALTGANAKSQAAGLFSGTLISQRAAEKQENVSRLKEAAKETLNTVVNTLKTSPKVAASDKALTTAENLVRDTRLRKSVLSAAREAVDGVRNSTPFGIASTLIQTTLGPLLNSVAKETAKAIADREGWECPSGFIPGGEFKADPIFTTVSEIFPNPITDITNSVLSALTCVRYNADKTVDTAMRGKCGPDMTKTPPKFCYAASPVKLIATPPTPLASACDADKDITRKLQLISNWITNYTLTNASVTSFNVINSFSAVFPVTDVLIECTFNMSTFSKNKASYNQFDGPRNGTPTETRGRFFFTKNGCTYTMFGYSSGTLGGGGLLMYDGPYAQPSSFVPTPDPRIASIRNGMATPSIADPVKHVLAGNTIPVYVAPAATTATTAATTAAPPSCASGYRIGYMTKDGQVKCWTSTAPYKSYVLIPASTAVATAMSAASAQGRCMNGYTLANKICTNPTTGLAYGL
jgi:hypothetical protein